MYRQSLYLALLISIVFLNLHCGGEGGDDGLPGEEIASSSNCVKDDCITTTLNEAGNFTVGKSTGDDTVEIPDLDVSDDEDTLTVSCGDDYTTEAGAVSFTCNLSSYAYLGAVCIHGVVYAGYLDDDEVVSTSCQSLNFYCDDYGFSSGEKCNTQNLIKGLKQKDQPVENLEVINQMISS